MIALAATFLIVGAPSKALALTSAEQDQAINNYDNEFYYVDSRGCGSFKVDTNGGLPNQYNFWTTAEEIEMVEDAYERSHETVYRGMIAQLVNGLNNLADGHESDPSDWCSWDIYNDDIMWACIALVRAYNDTGNYTYVQQAAYEFNEAWNRPYGWDSVNGGFFWATNSSAPDFPSKNSCVNCPACIAAAMLSEAYQGPNGFLQQAEEIYKWEVDNLFNQATGAVYDHVDTDASGAPDWSRVNKGTLTYNQGTMIGASMALYNALHAKKDQTGLPHFLHNALLSADYTRYNYTKNQGHDGYILPDEYGDGDTMGLKGIFMRWCGQWARQTGNKSYEIWLQDNANAAWRIRDNKGVSWSQWWHKDPNTYKEAWECSAAAAACQDVDPQTPAAGSPAGSGLSRPKPKAEPGI